MILESKITIRTTDPEELERISEGLVLARTKPETRDDMIAKVIYGSDGQGPVAERGDDELRQRVVPQYNHQLRAELTAALAARDQHFTDKEFYREQLVKATERALKAEKANKALKAAAKRRRSQK